MCYCDCCIRVSRSRYSVGSIVQYLVFYETRSLRGMASARCLKGVFLFLTMYLILTWVRLFRKGDIHSE